MVRFQFVVIQIYNENTEYLNNIFTQYHDLESLNLDNIDIIKMNLRKHGINGM